MWNYENSHALAWSLKKLLSSKWRKILLKELNQKVKKIETELFTVNEKNNEKKFSAHDLKRFERSNILGLINMPESLIKEFEWTISSNFEEFDAYED